MPILRAEAVEPDVRHVNYQALPPDRIWSWGPRRIADFELILALQGDFEFHATETGERVIQKPGTVLAIMPGELHTYRLLPAGRRAGFFSCIHLEPDPDGDRAAARRQIIPAPRRLTPVGRDAGIAELFRTAELEHRRDGRFRSAIVSAVVKQIWLRLAEKWAAPEAGAASVRLDAMVQFLRDRLLEHPGRQELAEHFHLTPQHVNLIFKRELGISPVGFVRRELAREAYRLLLMEQLSVKETALRLGFSSSFYFSRVFKQELGFPPTPGRRRTETPND
jgi:AraC-like DNA-binding protein